MSTKEIIPAANQTEQRIIASLEEIPPKQHEEKHIAAGQVLKSIVYGGLDGVINVLVIILSSVAANQNARDILGFCVGIVIGDGISMGLGDYLSARAQIQYIKSQQERQLYQVQHIIGDQIKEIVDIYEKKGFTVEESARIAQLYTTNHQAFVNIMMLQELGLVVIEEQVAIKCGIATFISFLIFGITPAIPYIITAGIMDRPEQNVIACCVIGGVLLFGLGFGKAKLIGINVWTSGLQSFLLGAGCTGIAFGIGKAFHQ